jgi:hypothetical protein
VDALMGGPQSPPHKAQVPPRDPLAPAQPQTGPYQGAAGSEAEHPGQQRVPLPDWANPSSPNYERRNYYVRADGSVVAREPGFYNPENPWDTGRPGEENGNGTMGYDWDPSYERRMSEPGITPWGPGGRASAAGSFPGPAGPSGGGQGQPRAKGYLDALFGATNRDREAELYPGMGRGRDREQIPLEMLAFLKALLQKGPAAPAAPRFPVE